MVHLRIPPLAGRQNLSHHGPLRPPLPADLRRHLARRRLLLRVVVEDGAAVLRAAVRALRVRGRRIVHAVEELEELAVRQLRGVVVHLERFGV